MGNFKSNTVYLILFIIVSHGCYLKRIIFGPTVPNFTQLKIPVFSVLFYKLQQRIQNM